MGHQGEASFQGLLRVLQLKVAITIGERGEDLAEMSVHGREGLHEGVLAQGGHRFDP